MNPKCKVDGCNFLARGKTGLGLCSMHYQRKWAFGDVLGVAPMRNLAGMGTIRPDGYMQKKVDGKRNYEHIRVAENALGHPLPEGAEVHHVNEDRANNAPDNLVICTDRKYHQLLHMRQRAVDAGFPAHYRRCYGCKNYDDPQNMKTRPTTAHIYHRGCK